LRQGCFPGISQRLVLAVQQVGDLQFPMTPLSPVPNSRASTGCQASPVARANYKGRGFRHRVGSYLEDLHHFIAEMVDYLHSDAARLWLIEWTRRVAVQRGPRLFVDFSLESCFQRFVGIVCA